MTNAADPVCHVVIDIMPHLAVPDINVAGRSHDQANREAELHVPGVVLTVDGATMAVIGFHHDRSGEQSLALSDPVFLNHAEKENQAVWFRSMLRTVVHHTRAIGLTAVRFIDWECPKDSEDWMSQELTIAGFAMMTSIIGWKIAPEKLCNIPLLAQGLRLSLVDLSQSRREEPFAVNCTETFSNEQRSVQQRLQTIAETLTQILRNTDDVKGLPTPCGAQLLSKWGAQGCTVLVAETDAGIAGICAFAFEPSRGGQTNSSGQIEYLGVRSDLQRQGIAAQMLSYLCRGIQRGSDRPIDILAFADESNVPACSLYRRLGFESCSMGRLWYQKVVDAVTKQKEPS